MNTHSGWVILTVFSWTQASVTHSLLSHAVVYKSDSLDNYYESHRQLWLKIVLEYVDLL